MKTTRIHLWSGPRNVSTALMYAFAQRPDCRVEDEPLYGYYLKKTGANHPGKEEIMAEMDCDLGNRLNHFVSPEDKAVLFYKQMTHHLVDVPLDFLITAKNVLLIRDPKSMIISFAKVIDRPEIEDLGIRRSVALYRWLRMHHEAPIVLDATEILKDPKKVLHQLCEQLGIPFSEQMPHWEAGARDEDGIWAKYWYNNVHQSQGFAPYVERNDVLPDHLRPLYERCQPYYEFLFEHAIKA